MSERPSEIWQANEQSNVVASRITVLPTILLTVSFGLTFAACLALLGATSRAAKCWVQLDGTINTVNAAIVLGAAGVGVWLAARLTAPNAQAVRRLLRTTFASVSILLLVSVPLVALGAYPLSAKAPSQCNDGQLEGLFVSGLALSPLVAVFTLAVGSLCPRLRKPA